MRRSFVVDDDGRDHWEGMHMCHHGVVAAQACQAMMHARTHDVYAMYVCDGGRKGRGGDACGVLM